MSQFDQYIVIGTGKVAWNCALHIKDSGFDTLLVENKTSAISSTERLCAEHGIAYKLLTDKAALTTFFQDIQQNTLVVSASNRYIFPESVVQNRLLYIINYHAALLPKFPGRNAEAWAIYENEKTGGITWHRVVRKVDAGAVLAQAETTISDSTTSFKLIKEYSSLAISTFKMIFPKIIDSSIQEIKQTSTTKHPMRYSWMKPNDGILDANWEEDKIHRFLRSFDYGPFKNLGDFYVKHENSSFLCARYKIYPKDNFKGAQNDNDTLILEKEKYVYKLHVQKEE